MKISKPIYFLVFALTVTLFSCKNETKKTLYVDVVKVFNEFNLSKELKKETESTSQLYQSQIDSMTMILNGSTARDEAFMHNMKVYQDLQQKESAYIDEIISQSDEKIWNQLNVYFKQFGKREGAKLLIGGNGSGNVLYVDERTDVTLEFLEFANSKYEGE